MNGDELPRQVAHRADCVTETFCGVDRDRTDDLRLAKPALSQLSYDPDKIFRGPGQS